MSSVSTDYSNIALYLNGGYAGSQLAFDPSFKDVMFNPITIGMTALSGGMAGWQHYSKHKGLNPNSAFESMREDNIFGKNFRKSLYADKTGINRYWKKGTLQPHVWWNDFLNNENRIQEQLKPWDEKANLKKNASADLKKAYRHEVDLKHRLYKTSNDKLKLIKDGIKNKTLKGDALRKEIRELETLINKADLKVLEAIKRGDIKPRGIFAKMAQYSGWNKVKRGYLKLATKNGTTYGAKAARLVGKGAKGFVKGGGLVTSAIELACETPEIIDTYKQLGAGKGTKQLLKSATTAAASGVGWWAGAKAGAAIGGALGSIIPGVGNAVGAAIGGIIGGFAGSFLANKAAKAVVGKSELQKENDKNNAIAKAEGKKIAQNGTLEEKAQVIEAGNELKEQMKQAGMDEKDPEYKLLAESLTRCENDLKTKIAQLESAGTPSHAGDIAWDGTSQTIAQQNGPDYSKELNLLNNLSSMGSSKSYAQNSFTMPQFTMNPFAMNNNIFAS